MPFLQLGMSPEWLTKSYMIKKVNSTSAWNNIGWLWNNSNFFRSYWAVNPTGVKLKYNNYSSIDKTIGEIVNNKRTGGTAAYCQENAADNFEDGTKKTYTPSTQTSNRTQAIIAALLVTVDNNNIANPISLAKWAGSDYTEESVKEAMLSQVGNSIWYINSEKKWENILLDHVKLVSAVEAGEANTDNETSKRYLSYLNLIKDAENIQFYSKSENTEENKLSTQEVNDILKSAMGAKVWKDGMTYYYTDLGHLGTEDTKGKYGVVRNHIYDVQLNSVKGLGTPVYNPGTKPTDPDEPDEPIIPQKPDDDETYIAAKVNILSWRVVINTTHLEW